MAGERTVGVLLAGGASSRMGGRPKALLQGADGRTFLARLVGTLRRGGCQAVLVVGGYHVGEIARELPREALLVHNARWAAGQLSSAQEGLRAALEVGGTRVALHLVDQPLIRPGDVWRVLAALDRGAELAVAAHRGEPGHPIALTAGLARRVVGSRAAHLRAALERAAPRRAVVDACSPGCVRGANTPAELRQLVRGR